MVQNSIIVMVPEVEEREGLNYKTTPSLPRRSS